MKLLYVVSIWMLFVSTIPLQVFIAVLIVLFDGYPALFSQLRTGKNGVLFTIYKFRTMRLDAHKHQSKLRILNQADGPVFKIYKDPRFTNLGSFLSHSGLDELPQLWNVVNGSMALFGPRPLPVAEVNQLKPWQKKRHVIKPGIISPAILTGRYHEDFDAWMRSDCGYVTKKSISYDLMLTFLSIKFFCKLLHRELMNIS